MSTAARRALFPQDWKRHDRPTSPGLLRGDLVFTSGQVGTRHADGSSVGESAHDQTVQALRNLEEVLAEAGGSLRDVVKTTVFVADRADVAEMNRGYAAVMPQPWPARSCVQAGLARPELKVEIEAIAVLADRDPRDPQPTHTHSGEEAPS